MPQLFPKFFDRLVVAALIGVPCAALGLTLAVTRFSLSPWLTREKAPIDQPVPFSHAHHVGEIGIDCRYCHTSVAVSSSAGLPPTETCMTCHSQIYQDAPVLQPVRESYARGAALEWNRVHQVPGFVYFNHSAHVNKGVACIECHGAVDQMQLIAKQHSFYMSWCLDCHRHPEGRLTTPDQVFAPEPAKTTVKQQATWVRERHIDSARLEDCSVCHR